ncbi:MAG TPA: energy transducer TonB [Rhizomicrobium sp.]|nr:energy transducer TonB [Rhizomicrobium sp.]
MIIVEFIIFVVSSGLFFNGRFRHQLWAVLVAGGIATGSSLLFVYDLVEKLAVHTEAPVKIVKQVVRVPVVQHVSQPPQLSKAENCRKDYPLISRLLGDEGTTDLSFQVLSDGTLSGLTVAKTSGSDRLDDAAVDCVKHWHYRPGLKDGQLADMPMTVSVAWNLKDDSDKQSSNPDTGKK